MRTRFVRDCMRIELHNPEAVILSEIADPRMKQSDIALTYAFIIRQQGDNADYARINRAICERWKGKTALARIKEEAWRRVVAYA